MKEGFLVVTICIMLCLMGVAFMFFVLGLHEQTVGPVDNSVETVDNCEHDWVVVSKYHFLTQSWRNISKCSRCGEVVK